MRTPWARRRVGARAVLRAVLVLAVLVAGCGGADETDGPPSVPDGFVTSRAGSLSLSHPEGWEVIAQEEGDLRVAEPGDDAVRPSAAVSLDSAYSAGAEGFGDAVTGTLTVLGAVRQDLEQGEVEVVDLPGSDVAQLVTSTFTTGGSVAVDHVDLFALTPDGQLVHARAEAPVGDVDPAVLRDVVQSVRIG